MTRRLPASLRTRGLLSQVLIKALPPVVLMMAALMSASLYQLRQGVEAEAVSALERESEFTLVAWCATMRRIEDAANAIAANRLIAAGLVDTDGRDIYLPAFFGKLRAPGADDARIMLVDYRGRLVASNQAVTSSLVGLPAAVIEGESALICDANGLRVIAPVQIHEHVEGAVVFKYSLRQMTQLLRRDMGMVQAVLLSPDGRLLFASTPQLEATSHAGLMDPMRWLTVDAPAPMLEGFTLRSLADREQVMAIAGRQAKQDLVIMGLISLAVLVVLFVCARMATAPMREMHRHVQQLSADSTTAPLLPVTGPLEARTLSSAFNRLVEELRATNSELQDSQANLEQRVIERTRDLDAARQAAIEANESKSKFLANMSHEVRTPLTAILGYTELLEGGQYDASTFMQMAATIRRNGEHLLGVINDVLDVSKIEAGRMTVERIAVDPTSIVHDVYSLMNVHATDKKLALELDWPSDLPRSVMCDPLRLRQILLNLTGNAIKFTQSGSVVIRTAARPNERGRHDSDVILTFTVIDTGIGIDADKCKKVFGAFSQADESTTRRFGGSGLGLVISRRLAQLLGGDIQVQSTPGSGSAFTLELCVPDGGGGWHDPRTSVRESHPAREASALPELRGRVLLVEDGPDNLRLITRLLERTGLKVETAINGLLAVEKVEAERKAGRGFDLIVMDMQMPEMDGYTAASTLRKQGCATPILALTANAMESDRVRCLKAGCSEYAAKPIDRPRFYGLVQKLVEETQSLEVEQAA